MMNTRNMDDTHPALWLLLELVAALALVAAFVFEYVRSQTYGDPNYVVSIGLTLVFVAAAFFRRRGQKRQ